MGIANQNLSGEEIEWLYRYLKEKEPPFSGLADPAGRQGGFLNIGREQMIIISSRDNARIKLIRSLRNRKDREETGLYFIESVRLVRQAVEAQADIQTMVVAPELLDDPAGQKIVQGQIHKGVPCIEVTPSVFESIAVKEGHQGIGAVLRQRWESLQDVRLQSELCWVAISEIQYPGNLGTILRICDAVGGGGIILMGHSTDPYDPVSVRASTGAVFWQRIVKATFQEFAAWKKQHGYYAVGTSPAAVSDYHLVSYQPPVVLLMGSERIGLTPEQQSICDLMVKIPMVGRCDSHHLTVATGIVLYEIFNQSRDNR